MPYSVPSTAELTERNFACIEASLNQNTPLAEKAFNRVLATTLGMADKEIYRYAADLIRENLALTASEGGLMNLGEEYGIYRVPPTLWKGKVAFSLPDGESLYYGTVFVGPQNMQYEIAESVTAPYLEPGSGVVVNIACIAAGPQGNLSVDDVLTIQKPLPIPGAGRTARVLEITLLGAPIEDLEVYRQRVFDIIRYEGGGGNSSDYRRWAQAVYGVRRAYPFSGPPEDSGRLALPGERTVYVECMKDIDCDGIPPQSLLDLVRSALLVDPASGASRAVLGITEDTLNIRPIIRTALYITVSGMTVSSGHIGDAQEAIKAAMEAFSETFGPFVQGLDPDFDRRDTVTALVISREVQNVLDAYGGTAQSVLFGTSFTAPVDKYELKRNEKIKFTEIQFLEAGENA
jgi:hypothetical protein